MTDIVDKATRSRMMAGITATDTKPEVILRRAPHAHGSRFRLHVRVSPERRALALRGYRAVCLVHGRFWHRHGFWHRYEGCSFATTPATRPESWRAKFDDNVERDRGFKVSSSRLAGESLRPLRETVASALGCLGQEFTPDSLAYLALTSKDEDCYAARGVCMERWQTTGRHSSGANGRCRPTLVKINTLITLT